MSLLGPTDPPPFEVLNEGAANPVLLICDHASKTVPASLDHLGLEQDILDQHVGWDIGAAAVARSLAERLNAPAVLAGYSRLVIDANRQPGDPASIPEISDEIPIPGNQSLSEEAQVGRTEAIFWPYHHRIADALAHLWREGPPPALFSVHSFTPAMNGEDRPWDIGVLWNRDPRIAEPLIYELRRHPDGLNVGDNKPYSGNQFAYSLDFHAGAAGLPNCAVEIRQDRVDTDEKAAYWAGLLAEILERIIGAPDLHRVEHY